MDYEHNYYSVILKGCSHRESLGRRLEDVLLRGRLAIKIALDTMPSVIIYKGNVDKIVPVLKAFNAEKAAITVLADGLPPALPLDKIYPDFSHINPELQLLLKSAPNNLWLGETIYHIAPAKYLEENGALVISSHALYFVDQPAGDKDCRWLIILYGQICESSARVIDPKTTLTIRHQDATSYQHAVFTIPEEFLISAKQSIKQAITAKRYLTRIKTSCRECGYISEDYADNAPTEERCRNCDQPYERTIIA